MVISTKTLVEAATLTEEDDAPNLAPNCPPQALFKAIAHAARDKALWAVVDWLHGKDGWPNGKYLDEVLTYAGIERPNGEATC